MPAGGVFIGSFSVGTFPNISIFFARLDAKGNGEKGESEDTSSIVEN